MTHESRSLVGCFPPLMEYPIGAVQAAWTIGATEMSIRRVYLFALLCVYLTSLLFLRSLFTRWKIRTTAGFITRVPSSTSRWAKEIPVDTDVLDLA